MSGFAGDLPGRVWLLSLCHRAEALCSGRLDFQPKDLNRCPLLLLILLRFTFVSKIGSLLV